MNLLSLIDRAIADDSEALRESSFKDFHSKGMDYLCLKRTPEHTVKIYVLDGDASKLPEVVNPHDHRYPFKTTVLHGLMIDYRYKRSETSGVVFEAFDYLTPLNGGNGFTHRGEERLVQDETNLLRTGDRLLTAPEDLHTIKMASDVTVLVLEQYGDILPIDAPTSTWIRKGSPKPDTSGLYSKFTEGEFKDKLKWLRETVW